MPETIDLTPTWRAAMPIIIAALEDGTDEGKRLARAELMALAGKLDAPTPPAMGRTFWIAGHEHRHGVSLWPLWQDEKPTEESIIESLGSDFEKDRDESVIFDGPFTVPSETERRRDDMTADDYFGSDEAARRDERRQMGITD